MPDPTRRRVLLAFTLALAGAGLLPLAAAGVARWEVETKAQFAKGEMQNVVLDPRGRLALGRIVTSVQTGELSIWCSAEDAAGTLYFGTGAGALLRCADGKLDQPQPTGEALVTCLLTLPEGGLCAGTLPNGKIFRIGADGKPTLFSTLAVPHIWALLSDGEGGLVVATGPGGKVFRVDREGKSLLLYDTKRECALSLARDRAGRLLIGTARPGLVYRLAADGRASIVADFGDTEVRALRVAADGTLFCAVNAGVKVAPQEFLKALKDAAAKGAAGTPAEPTTGTKAEESGKAPAGGGSADAGSGGGGSSGGNGGGGGTSGGGGSARAAVTGTLWRLAESGVAPEEVVTLPESYLTDLFLEADGNLLVATNNSGRIYRVTPEGEFSIPFDFAEHQVLTLLGSEGRLKAAGTGDVGAIHLVDHAAPVSGSYLAEVFDAKTAARWGAVEWRGSGKVTLETRSGNTAQPDETWADWAAPADLAPWPAGGDAGAAGGGAGKVASPPGRYLQFRLGWGEDREARVSGVSVAYAAANQRPRVLDLTVGEMQEGNAATPPAPGQPPEVRRLPVKKLRWKAVDADGDALVYWLAYREVRGEAWIPINRDVPLRGNEVVWNTDSVPEGRYVVRITACDEESNARGGEGAGAGGGGSGVRESAPFVVDNRKPELVGVAVGGAPVRRLSGTAQDGTSPIARIEFRVDDGEWRRLAPADGLCDDLREAFAGDLPELARGLHVILVRAVDAAGNAATALVEVRAGE
ncbi:MAG: hypothetical protein HZA54_10415 [Planctomycetes bacterium]|nr:hypothetical protein [Planctomycetota bacterium]